MMALKKSSNEKVFEKILAELKEELNDKCVRKLDQLRWKYRWFKQEWRKANTKICSGNGLAAKDIEVPKWYLLLDPILTEGVDNKTCSDNSSEDESGDSTFTSKRDISKRSSSSASTASAIDVRDSGGSEDELEDCNEVVRKAKKPAKVDNKSRKHETDLQVTQEEESLKLIQLQCGKL